MKSFGYKEFQKVEKVMDQKKVDFRTARHMVEAEGYKVVKRGETPLEKVLNDPKLHISFKKQYRR